MKVSIGDESVRSVDDHLLGTGYRVDISRYEFLDLELLLHPPLQMVSRFLKKGLRHRFAAYTFLARQRHGALARECNLYPERVMRLGPDFDPLMERRENRDRKRCFYDCRCI